MFFCARCKKEFKDEPNLFGMCSKCVSLGKRVDKINDDIIIIPPYVWIRVNGSDNRFCVMNESTFEKLFKTDFDFKLKLNEDNYEIYLSDSDIKFKEYLSELYGKRLKFNNVYDFRLPLHYY